MQHAKFEIGQDGMDGAERRAVWDAPKLYRKPVGESEINSNAGPDGTCHS